MKYLRCIIITIAVFGLFAWAISQIELSQAIHFLQHLSILEIVALVAINVLIVIINSARWWAQKKLVKKSN